MRVLILTARYPFPPIKGDQAVPYHRIRALARDHEIHLLSLVAAPPDNWALQEMRQYCRTVRVIVLPKWRSWLSVLARGPFSAMPLQVLYFLSQKFQSAVV